MDRILPPWAIDELRDLIDTHRHWKTIKKNMKNLVGRLGWEPSANEVFDVIVGGDKTAPCGKDKSFNGFSAGYVFCAPQCECAKESNARNRKETMMLRYGVEYSKQSGAIRAKADSTMEARYGHKHALSSPEIMEKLRATNRERLGVDYPSQSSEVMDKTRATNRAKYGNEIPSRSKAVSDKISSSHKGRSSSEKEASDANRKQTMLERYGVDHSMKCAESKDKLTNTVLEKYGTTCVLTNPDIKTKTAASNLKNFGDEVALRSPIVRGKINKTVMERYGVEHVSHIDICQDTIDILGDGERLKAFMAGKSFKEAGDLLGVTVSCVLKNWHKHGFRTEKSSFETSIHNYLDSIEAGVILKNKRNIIKGKELDFYLPDHKVAIEFNGLYWHSDKNISNDYHAIKTKLCHDQGIRLLMIDEEQWIYRQDVVQSKILNMLGKSPRGVGGRKLQIERIDAKSANAFFEAHHLQGRTGTIIESYGAMSGGQLVAAMAFNRQRGTGAVELVRFCSDGATYAGLFSKMFKWAREQEQFDEVISFSDLRYSEGDVYRKNGFEFVNEIAPDYRYIVGTRTYHKSSFTKKRIAEKYKIDMSAITEREAMAMLKIGRIYDCGKLKFVWRR